MPRHGVRRYARYGQTALDLGRTLDSRYVDPILAPGVEEDDVLLYTGTCQSCGAYLDVRQHKTCPHIRPEGGRCDGYIG